MSMILSPKKTMNLTVEESADMVEPMKENPPTEFVDRHILYFNFWFKSDRHRK